MVRVIQIIGGEMFVALYTSPRPLRQSSETMEIMWSLLNWLLLLFCWDAYGNEFDIVNSKTNFDSAIYHISIKTESVV